MKMKRLLFLAFLALFFNTTKSQIVMSEVGWTNNGPGQTIGTLPAGVTPPSDLTPDYIELYNATPGFTLSLNGYYLTNSQTDLYKWKIPSGLSIAPYQHMTFFCTGLNLQELSVPYCWHTNFTIEQCKNQWVMLTYNGVIKDSIFVRRTKAGDSWGHYPDGNANVIPNTKRWYLFSGGCAQATNANNTLLTFPGQVYYGYAPAPTFTSPTSPGFNTPNSGFYDMVIPDTVNFQINYTQGYCGQLGGTIPCPTYSGCIGTTSTAATYTYQDGLTTPISPVGQAQVITAVTFPKPPTGSIGTGLSDTAVTLHFLPSFEETNTYFDGPDLTTNPGFGVLSAVVDSSFFRYTAPCGTCAVSPTIHVEYFDKNKFYSEGGGVAVKPPNDGWLNRQKGFDVGFNDETGQGCSLTGAIYNDATFGTSTRTVFPNFEVRAAGKDNFSNLWNPAPSSSPPPLRTTHMRDAFAQTYAMKSGIQLDGMHYKPIKTYINGCYWGIYEFREIPDQDYLSYYYNLDRDSVDILRMHGAPSIITSNQDTGWVTTPLSGPGQSKAGTFNHVAFNYLGGYNNPYYLNLKKRLNINSFMDFFIYNSFFVNPEPPALNMSWWRRTNNGDLSRDSLMRWRYFMWDMNNILDLEVQPISTPTTVSNMTNPCIYTSTLYPAASFTASSYTTTPLSSYAGHGFILSKLMSGAFANIEFRHGYITRYMDLLNTVLKCDKLIQHYNYFKTIFTPEIPFHSSFWNLNQPDWDFAMDTLKIRITQRCEKVDSMMQKCMNLAGPYLINLDVRPSGAGTIDFNTLHLSNFIWSGEYYQNKVSPYILSYLEAWPTDTTKYVFDHWEWTSSTNSLTALPQDINDQNFLFRDSLSFVIGSNDNITAVFTDKRDNVVFPTGFTPNADGINDVFSPLGIQARYARDYEMQVWNRWGEEIFRSTTYTQGWDGTHKGVPAQTGVYAWMLKYKNVDNEYKVLKGNVTLIR